MSKTKFVRLLSGLLTVMLIAVIAFTVTGCSSDKETDGTTVSTTSSDLQAAEVLGEGKTIFDFTVVDPEGNNAHFEIRTDKETVGEALLEVGLIDGEDGPYGLYVKTVNGVTVDYDKDGKYWAFYENGALAAKGVDQTPINPDAKYEFRAE